MTKTLAFKYLTVVSVGDRSPLLFSKELVARGMPFPNLNLCNILEKYI